MRQIHNLSVTKKSSSNTSYSNYSLNRSCSSHHISAPTTPSYWPNSPVNYGLQKSQSITDVIESERGFKPSDRNDPSKRDFLTSLTKRVFKVGLVSCCFDNNVVVVLILRNQDVLGGWFLISFSSFFFC